jgi:hypothetical protein
MFSIAVNQTSENLARHVQEGLRWIFPIHELRILSTSLRAFRGVAQEAILSGHCTE